MFSGNRETAQTALLHRSLAQVVLWCVECQRLIPLLCFPCCPPPIRKGKRITSSLNPSECGRRVFSTPEGVKFFPEVKAIVKGGGLQFGMGPAPEKIWEF